MPSTAPLPSQHGMISPVDGLDTMPTILNQVGVWKRLEQTKDRLGIRSQRRSRCGILHSCSGWPGNKEPRLNEVLKKPLVLQLASRALRCKRYPITVFCVEVATKQGIYSTFQLSLSGVNSDSSATCASSNNFITC